MDPSTLTWYELNLAPLTELGEVAGQSMELVSAVWDSAIKPAAQASIGVMQAAGALAGAPATSPMTGVRDTMLEALGLLTSFLDTRLLLTFHQNVKVNPRFSKSEVVTTGQVSAEEICSTPGTTPILDIKTRLPVKKGTLRLRVPKFGGGTVIVMDDDGRLVGEDVVAGRITYLKRTIHLEMAWNIPAGTVTADYRNREISGAQYPFQGTGYDFWVDDILRTFPTHKIGQSLSGLLIIGGSKTPDDISGVLALLGRLFGQRAFLQLGKNLEAIGERLGQGAVTSTSDFARVGSGDMRPGAPLGPPKWLELGMAAVFPPLGDIYRATHKLVKTMIPPTEIAAGASEILSAIDGKIANVDDMVTEFEEHYETFKALAAAVGTNLYVLPLIEDNVNGTGPLGWSSAGTVVHGAGTDAQILARAIKGAAWQDDAGNVTHSPPKTLQDNAMIAGVALIAASGQDPFDASVVAMSQTGTSAEVLSFLLGQETLQTGRGFGEAVRDLAERPPTTVATTA
jgi:hypothetical protein